MEEQKPMRSEIEVFKDIETRILTHTINIKRVIKYTDKAKIVKDKGLGPNDVWCAVDFLPKKNKTICGKRESVVLIHFFIGSVVADGLYIVDEETIKALHGFKGGVIDSCLYETSSECFKEKSFDAWTKYARFRVTWKPDPR